MYTTTFPQTWCLNPVQQDAVTIWKNRLASSLLTLQNDLTAGIVLWQELHANLRQIKAHAACLSAENTANPQGIQESAFCLEIEGLFKEFSSALDNQLLQKSETALKELFGAESNIFFTLSQRRKIALKMCSKEIEETISSLEMHGFHATHELYTICYGKMRIKVQTSTGLKSYSPGQLDNLFHDTNPSVRKEAFIALTAACKEEEQVFAQILRSIIGFRLKVYEARGWANPFFESYHNNNIEESTVSAMWKGISHFDNLYAKFLKKKQKTEGLDRLSWYDLDAPISSSNKKISYDDACKCIIDSFSKYSNDLASFAKTALTKGWIDAEKRENKAYGGFCVPLPQTKESRIFLNFDGTAQNMLVLAHELGHAYHNHVLFDQPELAQLYPMTLAETASTTCELFVLQELPQEDSKRFYHDIAKRSCTFFLNIRARYIFEQKLFKEIKAGFISSKRLCECMQEAQIEAYGNILDDYHPYFWVTKIHFYLTEYPSYNFPYTVGYCLSLAILKKAQTMGEKFGDWYCNFLQDTGKMSVEDSVRKHFGQEASSQQFWVDAIEPALTAFNHFLLDKP